METFYSEYFSLLEKLHTDFKSALQGLPQEALDWRPGPDTNSLAILAAHTAGSERYWIGDVAAGEPSNRDRPGEFRTRHTASGVLESRLDESLAYARRVLEQMKLSDLNETRRSSRHENEKLTCAYALLHALEHTAQHAAHAQLTRQLWEQS